MSGLPRPDGGDSASQALVGFCDSTRLWWLGGLRRGFRHCFVVMPSAGRWVMLDPLSHQIQLTALTMPSAEELAQWYRAAGMTVLGVPMRPVPPRAGPWRPMTCVEVVKRVLGIRAAWVFTPWQLHGWLLEQESVTPIGTRKKSKNQIKFLDTGNYTL